METTWIDHRGRVCSWFKTACSTTALTVGRASNPPLTSAAFRVSPPLTAAPALHIRPGHPPRRQEPYSVSGATTSLGGEVLRAVPLRCTAAILPPGQVPLPDRPHQAALPLQRGRAT